MKTGIRIRGRQFMEGWCKLGQRDTFSHCKLPLLTIWSRMEFGKQFRPYLKVEERSEFLRFDTAYNWKLIRNEKVLVMKFPAYSSLTLECLLQLFAASPARGADYGRSSSSLSFEDNFCNISKKRNNFYSDKKKLNFSQAFGVKSVTINKRKKNFFFRWCKIK